MSGDIGQRAPSGANVGLDFDLMTMEGRSDAIDSMVDSGMSPMMAADEITRLYGTQDPSGGGELMAEASPEVEPAGRMDLFVPGARRAAESALAGATEFVNPEADVDALYGHIGPTSEQEAAERARTAERETAVENGDISNVEAIIGEGLDAAASSAPEMVVAGAAGEYGRRKGKQLAAKHLRGVPKIGKPLSWLAGMAAGVSSYQLANSPGKYHEALDEMEQQGYDRQSDDARRLAGTYATISTAFESIPQGIIFGKLFGGEAKEKIVRGFTRAALKNSGKDGTLEAIQEMGDTVLSHVILDDRAREMLLNGEFKHLADDFIERKGRDALVAGVAGISMGGPLGAGTGEIERQRVNSEVKQDAKRLAVSMDPMGLTADQIADKAKDPEGARAVGAAVKEVGASEFFRAQQQRQIEAQRNSLPGEMEPEERKVHLEALAQAERDVNDRADRILDKHAEALGAPMKTADVKVKNEELDRVKRAEAEANLEKLGVKKPAADVPTGAVTRINQRLSQARSDYERREARAQAASGAEQSAKAQDELTKAREEYQQARITSKVELEGKTPKQAVAELRKEDDDVAQRAQSEKQREGREKAVQRQMELELPESMAPEARRARAEEIISEYEADPVQDQKGLTQKVNRLQRQRRGATTPEQIDRIENEIADLEARRGLPTPAVEAARRVLQAEGGDLRARTDDLGPEAQPAAGVDEASETPAAAPAASYVNPSLDQAFGTDPSQDTVEGLTPRMEPENRARLVEAARVVIDDDAEPDSDAYREAQNTVGALLDEVSEDGVAPNEDIEDHAFRIAAAADREGAKKAKAKVDAREEATKALEQVPTEVIGDTRAREIILDTIERSDDVGVRAATPESLIETMEAYSTAANTLLPSRFPKGSKKRAAAERVLAYSGADNALEIARAMNLQPSISRLGARLGEDTGESPVGFRMKGEDAVDLMPILEGVSTPEEAEARLRDWTEATGVEAAAHIAPDGTVLGAVTNNDPNGVMPPRAGFGDPEVVFTHTHPKQTPFSAVDMREMLKTGQPFRAILPDGQVIAARPLAPLGREEVRSLRSAVLSRLDGKLDGLGPDEGARVKQEAFLQALEGAGAIDYTVPFDGMSQKEKDLVNKTIDESGDAIAGLRDRVAGRQRAAEAGEVGPDGAGRTGLQDGTTEIEVRTQKRGRPTANPERVKEIASGVYDRAVNYRRQGAHKPSLVDFVKAGEVDQEAIERAVQALADEHGNKLQYAILNAARAMFPDYDFDYASFNPEKETDRRYEGGHKADSEVTHRLQAAHYVLNDVINSGKGMFTREQATVKVQKGEFPTYFHLANHDLRRFLEYDVPAESRFFTPLKDPDDTSALKKNRGRNRFTDDQLEPAARTARYFQRNRFTFDMDKLAQIKPVDMMSAKSLGQEGLSKAKVRQYVDEYDDYVAGRITDPDALDLFKNKGDRIRERIIRAEYQIEDLKESVRKFQEEHGADGEVGFVYGVDEKGRIYAYGNYHPQSTDAIKKIFAVDGVSLGDMSSVDASASGWQVAALMARDEVAAKNVNLAPGSQFDTKTGKRDLYEDTISAMKRKVKEDLEGSDPKRKKFAKIIQDAIFDNPSVTFDRDSIKQTVIAVNYGADQSKFRKSLQGLWMPYIKERYGKTTPEEKLWAYVGSLGYDSLKEAAPKTLAFQEWALDALGALAGAVETNDPRDRAKVQISVGLEGAYGRKRMEAADVMGRSRVSNRPVFARDEDGQIIIDPETGKPRLAGTTPEEVLVRVSVPKKKLDPKATARSLYSQLVQGFDASILHRAVEEYKRLTDGDFITTNHDAFTVPKDREGAVSTSVRNSMEEVMGQVDVPQRLYDEIMWNAERFGVLDKIQKKVQPFEDYGTYQYSDLRTSTPVFGETPEGDDVIPTYDDLPEDWVGPRRGEDDLDALSDEEIEARLAEDDPPPPSAFDMYGRVQDDLSLDTEYVARPKGRKNVLQRVTDWENSERSLSPLKRMARYITRNLASDQLGLKHIEQDLGMDGALVKEGMSRMTQMLTNESSRVNSLLYYGVPQWNEDESLYETNPDVKPLAEIFRFENPADYHRFEEYAYAKRDQGLIERGKDPRIVDDLRDRWLDVSPEQKLRYDRMLDDYRDFNNALLDEAKSSGLLSAAQNEALKEDGDYVPMFRHFDDAAELNINGFVGPDGLSHPDPGIKSLKDNPLKIGEKVLDDRGRVTAAGGQFGDLIENIQKNAVGLMMASQTNRAHAQVYKFMSGNLGPEVEEIKVKTGIEVKTLDEDDPKQAQRRNERDAVMFYRNGEKVYWKATGDPQSTYGLAMAVAGLKPQELDAWDKTTRAAGNFFRFTITNTPAFAQASIVRDMGQAYIQNGTNPAKVFGANGGTLIETISGFSDATRDLMIGAGVGAYQLGGPLDARAEDLRRVHRAEGATAASRISDAYRAYERVLGGTELATRKKIYEDQIARGMSRADALYEARNFMDYGRRGSSKLLRRLNYMILFLNPRIQGLYRIFEQTAGDNSPQGQQKKFLGLTRSIWARGAVYAGASLALRAAYHSLLGDEWEEAYEEIPTWDKSQHLYIPYPQDNDGPKRFLRIPRPFELGSIFGTIPVQMFDSYVKDSPNGPNQMGDMLRQILTQTFSVDFMPQLFTPAYEVMTNRSRFTGGPVVPDRLADAPYFQQVDDRTGGIAQAVGSDLLSPIEIQHLVEGYLGPLGMYLYDSVDGLAASAGYVRPKTAGSAGVFGGKQSFGGAALEKTFGRFFTKTSAEGRSQFSREFYDIQRDIRTLTQGLNNAESSANIEEVERLMSAKDAPVLHGVKKDFNKINREISNLRGEMRKLMKSDTLNEQEKYDLSLQINAAIYYRQRLVVELLRDFGVTGTFASGLRGDTNTFAIP